MNAQVERREIRRARLLGRARGGDRIAHPAPHIDLIRQVGLEIKIVSDRFRAAWKGRRIDRGARSCSRGSRRQRREQIRARDSRCRARLHQSRIGRLQVLVCIGYLGLQFIEPRFLKYRPPGTARLRIRRLRRLPIAGFLVDAPPAARCAEFYTRARVSKRSAKVPLPASKACRETRGASAVAGSRPSSGLSLGVDLRGIRYGDAHLYPIGNGVRRIEHDRFVRCQARQHLD